MNELIDEETFLTLIKPKDILKCVCLVVADYSRPWTIKDSLKRWADFIYTVFGKLLLKYPFEKQKMSIIKIGMAFCGKECMVKVKK